MKTARPAVFLTIAFFLPGLLFAEEKKSWSFAVIANYYVVSDQNYGNPIATADRGPIHLETRYQYEDLDTGSVFVGWSFQARNKLEFSATPLLGGVFGNSNGVAPGYRVKLSYARWSLSSEGEYLFSTDQKESSFFYSWSELAYSPADWVWMGIAGQRIRAYQTDLDVQRGVFIGLGAGNFQITGYVMNPGSDNLFGLVSAGYRF